jgi:hypothetical protein
MAQIFNPKNDAKFWILFLGKKSAFMMAFNSIFAAKKSTSTLLHTLLLKTNNNVFGGQILRLVSCKKKSGMTHTEDFCGKNAPK